MNRPVRFFAVAAFAALGACTPVRWEHPTLGTAQTDADLNECSRNAWIEAQQQAFYYGGFGAMGPRYYRGRDGRLYYDPFWGGRTNDTFFQESRLRDYCMRSKGYNLVPVPAT